MPPPYTPPQRYNIITRFRGFGNPATAEVLFIGIEEGGNHWQDLLVENNIEEFDRLLSLREAQFIQRAHFGDMDPQWFEQLSMTEDAQIYIGMLLRCLSNRNDAQAREVYNHKLAYEFEFTSNFYPIAKPRQYTIIRPELRTHFGLPENYNAEIEQVRAQVLGELITSITENHPNCLIIVMGKTLWKSRLLNSLFPDVGFNIYDLGGVDAGHEFGWSVAQNGRGNIVLLCHPTARGIHRLTCERIDRVFHHFAPGNLGFPELPITRGINHARRISGEISSRNTDPLGGD
jgi:hypothetical protein